MKRASEVDRGALEERVGAATEYLSLCSCEVAKRIVGQKEMVEGMLMGLLARGHVLFEGMPGLAKTLAVRTLAQVLDVKYQRIQFTPDLLPADIIGTMVYRQQTSDFLPRKGPIFTNVVLADEINRAPAKVQSALLEAMEERQVTIGETTYALEDPFFVLATQNPIEHEGTYPLPEAQLDRFLLKLTVNYPTYDDEVKILRLAGKGETAQVGKVLDAEKISFLRDTATDIVVDSRIEEYIVAIVFASREKDQKKADYVRYVEYGASPRATLFLYRCAKIRALLEGRCFVIPEDVKGVAGNVLRHRVVVTYEAESEELSSDAIVTEILSFVRVP